MAGRGETTSMCRSRQSLRLVLRTQPRSVSQRFFGGNVEIAPSQPIDPDNGIA